LKRGRGLGGFATPGSYTAVDSPTVAPSSALKAASLRAVLVSMHRPVASARILRAYLLAATALGPGYFTFFGLLRGWHSAFISVVFGLATLLGWRVYWQGRHRLTAIILVAAIFVAPAWVLLFTSGARSPVVIWLTPAPFIASTMLGRKSAVRVGVIAVSYVALLGLIGVDRLPQEMTEPFARQLLTVTASVTAIAIVTFYGWVTGKEYETAQNDLAREHEALQTSSTLLDARNRAMRIVFDNVEQGLLTIDLAGRIGPERSRVVDEWFRAPRENETLPELLSELDESVGATLRLGLDELQSGFLPTEVVLEQLPKTLSVNARWYGIAYRLIETAGGAGLLVVMTDHTDARRAQAAERRNHELIELLRFGTSDPEGIATFISESTRLVRCVESGEQGDGLMRALHTLKGNSAVFGLLTLSAQVHDLEERLKENGSLTGADRTALGRAWAEERARIDALGLSTEDRVHLRRDELSRLLSVARSGADIGTLRRRVEVLCSVAARPRLESLGRQSVGLAERLSKKVSLEIADNDVRLPPQAYDDVWAVLAHVVRNAIDHGIEREEERVAAGKAPSGRLTLSTELSNGRLIIAVADDGRGVNWDAIRVRARALGLPANGQSELVEALFADGVSTRDEVTAISGRGVGTAAVAAAVRAHRGSIEVTSKEGSGTRFVLTLPAPPEAFVEPGSELRISAAPRVSLPTSARA
jgi:HPt (histidine-containing phosphotransfer) domain-containing protein/two-component sensor histidine kinase